MPASRRQIVSNQLYELEIRTRTGLPFAALFTMRLLLASAMARAQRDYKVVICHFIWMANHLHLLLVAKDAQECVNFYSELMKKVTDYMKRLLEIPHLELWEPGGPVLSQILDLGSALNRIAYFYANPSHAGLVDSISEYPGFSSWASFRANPCACEITEEIPWVRQPSISALPSRVLTDRQDRFMTEKLKSKNTRYSHPLTIHPNAFYKIFGIHDEAEIARYNHSVFADVNHREAKFAAERQRTGKRTLGAFRLKNQPVFKSYTPEKKSSDRKVLFHTTKKELAIAFLESFGAFCQACRMAYQAWTRGDYLVRWPPGAFRPPLCPAASKL